MKSTHFKLTYIVMLQSCELSDFSACFHFFTQRLNVRGLLLLFLCISDSYWRPEDIGFNS